MYRVDRIMGQLLYMFVIYKGVISGRKAKVIFDE
jgi:hypothetical protein